MHKYKGIKTTSKFEYLINLKGGSTKPSGLASLDLTNLMSKGSDHDTLFSWSQGSSGSDVESDTETDIESDIDSDLEYDIESNINVSSLIQYKPVLRTASQELPSKSKIAPVRRALSSGNKPIAHNPILIKHRGDTQEEINHNVSEYLSQILGKTINGNVIPVNSDGSCGISSIITLIKGYIPSTMESYDERRKIGVETLSPKVALQTECHGGNIDASYLIGYVSEELKINLIIIHENMLLLPSIWLQNEPVIFLIGDGEHYNAVEINSNKVIQPSNPIYDILLKIDKIDLGDGINGIFL